MALPAHLRKRAKARSPFDGAALGVYRGPRRVSEPPKLTPYRATLMRAIAAGEVKRGQGQYANAWRWHHNGQGITCSKWVNEFIACQWAKVVGAHVELTETGQSALDSAP
jgi:hypothetical protein